MKRSNQRPGRRIPPGQGINLALSGFVVLVFLLGWYRPGQITARAVGMFQGTICADPHLDVSTPLNDLGNSNYIRMDGQDTGVTGGLYPNGENVRPAAHEAAGIAIAGQIVPLDSQGNPDEANGKIVLVSIGMSNTAAEFRTFAAQANSDPEVNPRLVLINGAQPGMTADQWVDPTAVSWQNVYQYLSAAGLSTAQVQVAWVKLTHIGTGDFPIWPQDLQEDLEIIARNLKTNFPNIKIAYYSSRTRSYTYWIGLNPEPSAFESGFSVRWMIEKQINGDPSLNFSADNGPVVAPYLSWGAYLWIDGINPRSDGRVWLQEDMVQDCTHPTDNGRAKVAGMLMEYFKTDSTSVIWFLDASRPTPTHTVPPDDTATPSSTPVPSDTPTATATQTPTHTATAEDTQTPSVTPSPEPTTPVPTATPTIENGQSPSNTPSPEPPSPLPTGTVMIGGTATPGEVSQSVRMYFPAILNNQQNKDVMAVDDDHRLQMQILTVSMLVGATIGLSVVARRER